MADEKSAYSGEFTLIRAMHEHWKKSNVAGDFSDDAAILPLDSDQVLSVTTDMLIEGRHFKAEWSSPEDIGYKSVAVNLSDIAAMGSRPLYLFSSLGLETKNTEKEQFHAFISGMEQACLDFSCTIEGGDTTRSEHGMVISITAIGKSSKANIKKRNAAIAGDIIAVTGSIGDAAGALELLYLDQQKKDRSPEAESLYKKLHRPKPRVDEGIWLGKQPQVHAMMDLSDGLSGDIRHITSASKCGAVIDIERLPVSSALNDISENMGWSAQNLAATGGDDYELLFTVSAEKWDEFCRKAEAELNIPVTGIGTITTDTDDVQFKNKGKVLTDPLGGYDHFKT